ncbi:hypothetical protein JCM16106_18440 [Hydrogenophilus islandicus]
MSDLNDPRVFFAAERTLMAWNRTSITMMAFGFAIERFGLFLEMIHPGRSTAHDRYLSLFVGIAFITLALIALAQAIRQYRRVLATLKPIEIPERYNPNTIVIIHSVILLLGLILLLYLIFLS